MKKMTLENVAERVAELKEKLARIETALPAMHPAFAAMINLDEKRAEIAKLESLTQDDIDDINQKVEEFPAIFQNPYS